MRLDLLMKSNVFLYLTVLAILACPQAIATSESPDILVSTESIIKKTGALFYDGQIPVDMDGDGSYDSTIHYGYSRLGPAGTCSNTLDCAPETKPVITFYIDLDGKILPANFICESIGIYASKTNQRRNLFCGPQTKLYWNGSEYTNKLMKSK